MAQVIEHNRRVNEAKLKERINEIDSKLQSPVVKPAVQHGTLAKEKGKARGTGRITVRIKSCRKRLLDPDNLVGGVKYLLDGLRYAGILPDDNPDQITLQVSQEKVADNERTEIEIVY